MKYIVLLWLIILLTFSCKEKVEIPKGVLPQSKMQTVMLDLIRADEVVNQQSYGDSAASVLAKREILYQKVFQVHKLTKEQFKSSFNFYQNHPNLLKVVLDSMYEVTRRETIVDTAQLKKPKTTLKEQALERIKKVAK